MKNKIIIWLSSSLVSSLVKKIYDAKVSEVEKKLTDLNHNRDKYIPTPEFNTLTAAVFNDTLAQAKLIAKTDFIKS